jgi:ubiquinone/menaquinone biosynthesis C-methylase UbiE/DNA-binding transcriptional ArsR family regulator
LQFGLDNLVDLLKAAGEPTRFRLLALLGAGDLTVTDLTEILGQSQPRISRHLKLLTEGGLIDRYQEGAWAYFRLKQDGAAVGLVRQLLAAASKTDAVLLRDAERLVSVKSVRAARAQDYFSRNATAWDELRRLNVSDDLVEQTLERLLGTTPIDNLLDLGTGTGRILQLLSSLYRRATGVDASRDMLAVARSNLDKAGVSNATIRHGDILNLPLEGQDFDAIVIHQVLHYLDQPELAIAEAARMLRPNGRLVIIDLAPHKLDYLREDHAHVRLGFSHALMGEWLKKAGLSLERVEDLKSSGRSSQSLDVTIWLARDPRLQIATDAQEEIPAAAAGRA